MNNFKSGGFKKGGRDSGGGKRFGGNKFGGERRSGGSFGGGRDRDERSSQKFPAVCAECNKRCEVPFRPSGDKPVYCSDCFGKQNQDGHRSDRGGDRGRREERADYTKLPRDQRPPRHDKSRGQEGDGLGEIKRQLATIETRLNRILDLINPPTEPEKKIVTPAKKEKQAKKVVDKPALKEALNNVVEPVVAKKAVKKATKKAAKKTAKKVVKKATKKSAKKATKKAK